MSPFVFGPHILTNTTVSGRPFSARFRATVTHNGTQRENVGRIFRDSAGRLRTDIEYQGTHVGYRILDRVSGVQTMVNDINRAYVAMDCAAPPHTSMPDPSSEKRMVSGVECLRYPLRPTLEEAWVSPELEFVVYERVLDKSGESTWELYDIVMAEPDKSLFRIPVDYTASTGPDA